MIVANGMLLFHDKSEIYSNWYARPVTIKGITFSCLEQTLMLAKARLFSDEVRAAQIMATSDPARHKQLGRLVEGYVDSEWSAKRRAILWHGVYAKFTQHDDLKAALLATEELELVEASGKDLVYGVGFWQSNPRIYDKRNWRGQNLLGEVLMSVRDEIRQEEKAGAPHRVYS